MLKQRFRLIGLVGLLSLILAGCGTISQAQSGNIADLPTAPPAPTAEPFVEPVIPDAPQAAAPSKAPVKYSDSFDKQSSDWQVLDIWNNGSEPSTWSVKNKKLHQVSGLDGNVSHNPTAFTTGDAAWTDYTIQAQAYSIDNNIMGLVGRVNDDGYYALVMRQQGAEGGKLLTLQRYNASTETFELLATSEAFGWQPKTWYTLQLSFSGNTITASVNGQQVLSATDSTFTKGRAGVYGYGESNLVFDNFIVQ